MEPPASIRDLLISQMEVTNKTPVLKRSRMKHVLKGSRMKHVLKRSRTGRTNCQLWGQDLFSWILVTFIYRKLPTLGVEELPLYKSLSDVNTVYNLDFVAQNACVILSLGPDFNIEQIMEVQTPYLSDP